MPTIYGFLERIIYYNEENDFIVAKLEEKGKKGLTTIVGKALGYKIIFVALLFAKTI